jgi:glutamyl-tRNA(Gln) amidotransferase subunit E
MKKNSSNSEPAGPRPPGDLNPRTDPVLDFPDRELGELTPADYASLGFMCGLEVHQQLLTRSKLFCRCPAGRRADRYDAEVLRHMRPTLSELGEYDGTALMEYKTRKEIVYRLDRGSVCTYEIDDTPPFEIDEEAVRSSLEFARLLDLNLVSELHVMRKQYLDGSIPTGFQRTAMVGLDGSIPFRVRELGVDRELRIRQLSLEEDSCREVSDVGHRITFTTDRLGTPLTETVTEPDLLTPFEVREGVKLISRLARTTGKVRRGPGAGRQDVNVSVAGGRRIEIKGVDNHRNLPLLVHTEAYRQLNLLRMRAELHRRGVTAEMLSLPAMGDPWEVSDLVMRAGSVLRKSDFAPLRDAMERGETVCALKLSGFDGLLNFRTQPGVSFAREISDRLRVIACLESRPFMIHSDLRDYGLDTGLWSKLAKRLGAGREDTLVVLWGPAEDAATAVREVYIRAREALEGIPAETRQAYEDGTNGFERILPGPDRMYPDTDTPPLPIPDSWVAAVSSNLPERPWDREERYRELGLDEETASRLVDAPWADLFDAVAPGRPGLVRRLASAFEKRLKHHLRSGTIAEIPDAERIRPLVRAVEAGEIRAEALERGLDALMESGGADAEEILHRFRIRGGEGQALAMAIRSTVERSAVVSGRGRETVLRWAMGQVMPGLLGRVDPGAVRDLLMEALP